MKLSIIVPAHNEGRRLPPMLKSYSSYFNELQARKVLNYELLVVINNSTDNTREVVKAALATNRAIRCLDFEEGGKGFAIVEGFKDALSRPNDLIGFVDADMATSPEEFYKLVLALKNNSGVIAARWRPDSRITKQTRFSLLKSKIFNFIARSLFLFPYSDTQCGAKLFTRRAVEYVCTRMSITKWAFDIDLLYKLRSGGFSVIEIPTVWQDKSESHLKVFHASLEMFLAIVRLRIIHSPFSFIVRAYDSLPQSLKVHHRFWRL